VRNEPERFLDHLRLRLVGHRLSFRRLACDVLLLYVECEPGDGKGVTIWLDPIWRLRGPQGVLVGSPQATDAMHSEEGLAAVSALLGDLQERAIERVDVQPLTFDLRVMLEGGYCLETFAVDQTVDESWHIRENTTGNRLKGSPNGLSIGKSMLN
jgi:hypothetical protein